jgi:crotonobetainyl-CoA:carnitine CoA-transferase CaiB-like acyl-CoA transferase
MTRPGMDAARAAGTLMSLIYREIARRTPERTTADWLDLLAANDIPAMRAADLTEVLDDPHFVATGFFRERDHPLAGPIREMRPPVRFGADPDRTLGFAPALGADGDAIRAALRSQHG